MSELSKSGSSSSIEKSLSVRAISFSYLGFLSNSITEILLLEFKILKVKNIKMKQNMKIEQIPPVDDLKVSSPN